MKPRLIASLVVGTALVLGTSGCSLISAHATTIEYSAAEGTNVPDESGPVQIRNTVIVANDEGTEGNFLAAFINNTDETYVVHIDFADGLTEQVIVPAGSVKSLGEDADPILVRGLDTPPGATLSTSFQSGDGVTSVVSVPVLNGDLEYLAPFVPESFLEQRTSAPPLSRAGPTCFLALARVRTRSGTRARAQSRASLDRSGSSRCVSGCA